MNKTHSCSRRDPNRGNASYRFIAFDMITGQSMSHAETARLALQKAGGDSTDFTEVLDCAENGRKVWTGGIQPTNPVPLHMARKLHRTVFRGSGYAKSYNPLPAVELGVEASATSRTETCL